jgi:predicted Na+-dependent transporter
VLLAFAIQAVADRFFTLNWWVLLILFVVYYVIYALATLFTRSFSKEDVALLLEIGKRSGINATLVKRILGRFL